MHSAKGNNINSHDIHHHAGHTEVSKSYSLSMLPSRSIFDRFPLNQERNGTPLFSTPSTTTARSQSDPSFFLVVLCWCDVLPGWLFLHLMQVCDWVSQNDREESWLSQPPVSERHWGEVHIRPWHSGKQLCCHNRWLVADCRSDALCARMHACVNQMFLV